MANLVKHVVGNTNEAKVLKKDDNPDCINAKVDDSSTLQELYSELFITILIADAIWAVDFFIDMVTDIGSWIIGKLKSLLNSGAEEVYVIRGDALADFIKQNQATGIYTKISLSQLNAMNNSVINVAMNGNTVVDEQMIRSNGGLSSSAKSQFQGLPTLKIKIAA